MRPKAILNWAVEMFGPIAINRDERACRFVEEAIELGQAAGLTKETVARIIDRIYARPIGEIGKEIGQAGMTLEALAENVGRSVDREIEREFSRVRAIPKDEWTRRHDAKVALKIANLSPIVAD